ncbi:hypothetical protein LCGC14_0643050 [marine sediment metagenome]|uniref:Uncharacterized protein n=1 Tax=marine sediment metagenome TaxID=412755 RepID=A0A0F9QYP7_9ZZZZ|nr:hypothetical protein [Candidatus Aminicenantes bacterium]
MLPSDYANWKQDPGTKEVFKLLREAKYKVLEILSKGGTLMGVQTAEQTGKAVGMIEGIDLVLELKPEDLQEEEEEE